MVPRSCTKHKAHRFIRYEAGMTLSGLIYMHRISDFRMGGVSRRNFSMFRKLCGDSTLKNVLIVTTMWGLVDPAVAEARETELKTDARLFKPVLDKGAVMARHDNTRQTAHAIIHRILQNHPLPLQIQHEMGEQGLDISQTAAAIELDREMAVMAEKHKKELAQIKIEMQEAIAARDEEARQEFQEMKAELEEKLRQNEHDRDRLSEEYAAEKRKADEALAKIVKDIEDQRNARAQADQMLGDLHQQLITSNNQAAEERKAMLKQITELSNRPQRRGICLIQ